MYEAFQGTASVALITWAVYNIVKTVDIVLDIRSRKRGGSDLFGSLIGGSSSSEKKVFVGLVDQRAIEIAACCRDKMTALTKHGIEEEEYEQLLERAKKFKEPMQDWLLNKPNRRYFEWADAEFWEKNSEELRIWVFENMETQGLEE